MCTYEQKRYERTGAPTHGSRRKIRSGPCGRLGESLKISTKQAKPLHTSATSLVNLCDSSIAPTQLDTDGKSRSYS